MKLKKILENIELTACTADPEMEISGICYDSRAAKPGDLFVAVRGFASDGHRFIAKAVENGAAAVLCEEPPEGEIPYAQTGNSRLGLLWQAGSSSAILLRKCV